MRFLIAFFVNLFSADVLNDAKCDDADAGVLAGKQHAYVPIAVVYDVYVTDDAIIIVSANKPIRPGNYSQIGIHSSST